MVDASGPFSRRNNDGKNCKRLRFGNTSPSLLSLKRGGGRDGIRFKIISVQPIKIARSN